MSDADLYKRMLQRERIARQEAERLLESKSLELWHSNQELQKSAAELESIFVATSDGIVTFDTSGVINSHNPSALRIFGYSDAQLIGMHVRELLPDEEIRQEMLATNYWVDECTEEQPHVSSLGIDAGGRVFDMELSASLGQFEEESIIIWVLRNTERIKQIERQSMVNQRLQAIGQLAAGVSHEINTPIQFVHENTKFLSEAFQSLETLFQAYDHFLGSNADRLDSKSVDHIRQVAEDCESDFYREEIPRAIKETMDGSQRVSSIVRAIKEFAHPGSEEKQPFNINEAIKSAMTVSSSHWKLCADIQTDFSPDLESVVCFGSDINQILLNLIVNASDAIEERSEADGTRGLITIATWRVNDTAKISISDTGGGIPRKYLDQIFTPFFTTKAVGKGTGQGLALVHSVIVERHGGQVQVETEVGIGTTFVLSIPMKDTGTKSTNNPAFESSV